MVTLALMIFDDLQKELELFLSRQDPFVALNEGHALICISTCDLDPWSSKQS